MSYKTIHELIQQFGSNKESSPVVLGQAEVVLKFDKIKVGTEPHGKVEFIFKDACVFSVDFKSDITVGDEMVLHGINGSLGFGVLPTD